MPSDNVETSLQVAMVIMIGGICKRTERSGLTSVSWLQYF